MSLAQYQYERPEKPQTTACTGRYQLGYLSKLRAWGRKDKTYSAQEGVYRWALKE